MIRAIMTQRWRALYSRALRAAILLGCVPLAACVYRIDIQQGNLLEDDDIALVEVGMTRSQVQFILGTPTIADPFHEDRWDYPYYFKRGRSDDITTSWVIVFFDGDVVSRIERDVNLEPSS
jgi:outer membrane protein assembly factor BamE